MLYASAARSTIGAVSNNVVSIGRKLALTRGVRCELRVLSLAVKSGMPAVRITWD